MTQISLSGVAVEFGAFTLLRDVTFTVAAGERWGFIGRNGSGKTTLFSLVTGAMQPSRGAVARQPGLRTALLEQHRDFGGAQTVWEAAAGGFAELLALEQSLAKQAEALSHDHSDAAMNRYARDLERFERDGGYEIAPRVDAVLHGLGFDPVAARTALVKHLSGGERGRLGLARQLVSPADMLLLDEPTNHLDLETTAWLERYLQTTTATVLLVSHDRAFLAAVVDHVLHLEAGTAIPYVGGYAAFVQQRTERRLTHQRAFEKQQRTIAHEQDYIARNIAGQNSRQAKGRRTRLARLPRLSAPSADEDTMAVRFDVRERGGDQVIVASRSAISVPEEGGGRRTLVSDFTGSLMRGDVVGLIGPNGAGKSTLIRAILGEHPVDTGTLRVGGAITTGYYRQDLAQVPLDRTLYDIINDLRPTWERRVIQGHLGRFGFSGDEVQRRPATLSGGERARVALAMLMLSGANLLVLDEPTNHLDVESIEVLEDAVEAYEGSVLVVSHDRELLRALTTKMWILHGGHVTEFGGGFAEWEVVAAERAHAAAVRAQEEEGLRRVKERQRTTPRTAPGKDARASLRKAERLVQEIEERIRNLEERIGAITGELEDPELYGRPGGSERAAQLGQELEARKSELERALEEWGSASEALVALSSS